MLKANSEHHREKRLRIRATDDTLLLAKQHSYQPWVGIQRTPRFYSLEEPETFFSAVLKWSCSLATETLDICKVLNGQGGDCMNWSTQS